MRIAMVADLHGNMVATAAMDKALEQLKLDEIWFLGDAVGKGPDNAETCDWVRSHCTLAVGGNWDYGIGGRQFPADHFFWNQLGEERMSWLNTLPKEEERWISGIRFRILHGRPVLDLLHANDSSERLHSAFTSPNGKYGGVIFADSHKPFIRPIKGGYMANTGSVGNSLGVPKAHALIVEGEMDTKESAPMMLTILSVPYDNQKAAERAMQCKELPHANAYINEVLTGIYSR